MIKIRKNKKGFTLVELIVVITVLAILAAIAIPIAGNWVGSAKTSSDVSNVAIFQSAIEKSAADGKDYPGTAADAVTVITSYSAISALPTPSQKDAKFYYNTTSHRVTCSAVTLTSPWYAMP